MLNAATVARYFLSLADEEVGDQISNLKLQKLLYYAQGVHLALRGAPLFSERVEAWQHGPVVPDVYHLYKHNGSEVIAPPLDAPDVDPATGDLLNEVYEVYGQFSAWKLRQMTHEEPPWVDAFADGPSTVIANEAMTKFFKTRLI
jgi:uncharacterized phage-associated protein